MGPTPPATPQARARADLVALLLREQRHQGWARIGAGVVCAVAPTSEQRTRARDRHTYAREFSALITSLVARLSTSTTPVARPEGPAPGTAPYVLAVTPVLDGYGGGGWDLRCTHARCGELGRYQDAAALGHRIKGHSAYHRTEGRTVPRAPSTPSPATPVTAGAPTGGEV